MKEWDNPKFRYLLTPGIWYSNYKNVKAILSLDYWKKQKYYKLLTPTIWIKTPKEVVEILSVDGWKDPKFKKILTPNIWNVTSSDNISSIMSMQQWENPKYKHLLTPLIWHANYDIIVRKLSLPCLEKHPNLLNPYIFSISIDNIVGNIELFEEYNLGEFITTTSLRRSYLEQRLILEYMVLNDIPLVLGKKLNPILNAEGNKLKDIYGIDINLLMKEKTCGIM